MSQESELLNNNSASLILPRKGVKKAIQKIPKTIMVFWFVFVAYLVLPFVEVPLLGLSLSAPIFFFIAIYCIFKPPQRWPGALQKWILLAVFIWAGIFISTLFNGILSGGSDVDKEGWSLLVQNAYWLLTFVITAYFASRTNILERTTRILGWAVFALSLVRLFEAVAWGVINTYEDNTRLLAPNEYGFLFSTFFPFLLAPVFSSSTKNKLLMIVRMLITAAAVVINGSRSSWISVAAGIAFFTLILLLIRPRKGGLAIILTGVLLVSILFGFRLLPEPVNEAIDQRASTFQNLDKDKSYVFRQMMVQKGLKLFKESPLIGVGASRFRKESTELELSGVFRFYAQTQFDRKSSHNSYIGFLAETGLVGSIPLAILILMLGVQGTKAGVRLAKREEIWGLGVITSFVGMSIHMWTVSALAGTVTWFAYGLVVTLILSDHMLQNRTRGLQ